MAEASAALTSLGSDLAFSISFAIASELLAAASEAEVAEDELVAAVMLISIILTAVPRSLGIAWTHLTKMKMCSSLARKNESSEKAKPDDSGLTAFLKLLIGLGQRIAVSVAIQLLAANARQRQPLRSVRIVTLLSVTVFFLFISGSASAGSHAKEA